MGTDQTYRAIADPTRRAILDLLAQHGSLAAGQIAQRIPALSRPAVSRHLRVLRQAALIASQRQHRSEGPTAAEADGGADGREQHYTLCPQPLELVQQWVSRYRGYWTDKLEQLAELSQPERSPSAAAEAVSLPGPEPQWPAVTPPLPAAPPLAPLTPELRPAAALPPLPMRTPQAVILAGQRAVLVPLTAQAVPFVQTALAQRELWKYSVAPMTTDADAAAYVEQALAETAAGRSLAFGIMAREDANAAGATRLAFAGSTRLGNISLENARVEIGWSWLLPQFQRSGINREAKLLLLGYAFDQLGARRVEFKGDARNEQSAAALRGIGATYEGTLRRHIALPDGTSRDSFYFSVIAEEWPAVKTRLTAKLGGL